MRIINWIFIETNPSIYIYLGLYRQIHETLMTTSQKLYVRPRNTYSRGSSLDLILLKRYHDKQGKRQKTINHNLHHSCDVTSHSSCDVMNATFYKLAVICLSWRRLNRTKNEILFWRLKLELSLAHTNCCPGVNPFKILFKIDKINPKFLGCALAQDNTVVFSKLK